MVLVGGEHRHGDQGGPGIHQPAQGAAGGGGKTHPDDDEQADVQRGRLVVGQVEASQGVEEGAKEAVGVGPGEAEAQGKGQEAAT